MEYIHLINPNPTTTFDTYIPTFVHFCILMFITDGPKAALLLLFAIIVVSTRFLIGLDFLSDLLRIAWCDLPAKSCPLGFPLLSCHT